MMTVHVAMTGVDAVDFVPFAVGVESSVFDGYFVVVVIRLEIHYFCKYSRLTYQKQKIAVE